MPSFNQQSSSDVNQTLDDNLKQINSQSDLKRLGDTEKKPSQAAMASALINKLGRNSQNRAQIKIVKKKHINFIKNDLKKFYFFLLFLSERHKLVAGETLIAYIFVFESSRNYPMCFCVQILA